MKPAATEVLIVGGGLGGVAAAIGAVSAGSSVVLLEQGSRVGGQLTTQGVPPDEHPWIEARGSTASYRGFRQAVRDLYRRSLPLTAEALGNPLLNPGMGWVSPLCHPPLVAERVLAEMLLPNLMSGTLQVMTGAAVTAADVEADRILSLGGVIGSEEREWTASYFLDATELGDLFPLAGVEHVTGSEAAERTGEPHAAPVDRPTNMQAFAIGMALDHRPGEDHTIDPPPDYEQWRKASLPGWPGPQISWIAPDPRTLASRRYGLFLEGGGAAAPANPEAVVDLWSYRRIVAAQIHPVGAGVGDVTVVNWPMNDYALGPLFGGSSIEDARHVERARHLTLSLVYWLQTEAPRPDGGTGYPGLRPRGDLMGTSTGLAQQPYVRESRRLLAEYTVSELDLAAACRVGLGPATFADSVGTGAYRIDLHPTTGGDPYLDLPCYPFEIPLRCLLPIRIDNLLPAAKNAGVTHIANGCFRVHPTEWTVGEAAGRLAAFCCRNRVSPRAVAHRPGLLTSYQSLLTSAGFDLHWPADSEAL